MTAYTRDSLVGEGRRATALAILSKPLDIDRMLGLLPPRRLKRSRRLSRGAA
jgi:hypothetical protein